MFRATSDLQCLGRGAPSKPFCAALRFCCHQQPSALVTASARVELTGRKTYQFVWCLRAKCSLLASLACDGGSLKCQSLSWSAGGAEGSLWNEGWAGGRLWGLGGLQQERCCPAPRWDLWVPLALAGGWLCQEIRLMPCWKLLWLSAALLGGLFSRISR